MSIMRAMSLAPTANKARKLSAMLNELVGSLWGKLKTLDLPVDLFVVSDHGMETVQGNWINLEQFADLSGFRTEGMLLYLYIPTMIRQLRELLIN
jgi:hypothetical protein